MQPYDQPTMQGFKGCIFKFYLYIYIFYLHKFYAGLPEGRASLNSMQPSTQPKIVDASQENQANLI